MPWRRSLPLTGSDGSLPSMVCLCLESSDWLDFATSVFLPGIPESLVLNLPLVVINSHFMS